MHSALPKSHHCCPFMISNQFALIQVLGFFGGHSAAQFQINFQLSEHMVRVSALDNWPRCLEYFFHFILILIIFVFVFVLFIIIFVFPGFVLVCSNCLMPAPPPVDPHRRVVPNLSCLIIITARKCIQTSCKHANLFFCF